MKNLTSLILMILTFGLPFVACDNSSEPDPEPVPEYPKESARSVLVYMVANNNLGNSYSHYDANDLSEMQWAMDSVKGMDGELMVFRAPYNGTPVLLRMRADNAPDTLKFYTDQSFKCLSEEGMKQVINDSREFVHAAEHGLVLWSHGSGWVQDGFEDASGKRRSYGVDGDMRMNVTSLASVLESGFDFDWLYFDCCFMNSIEVAYELRNAVPLIIGSATEVPAEGMPYQYNVPEFLKKGGSDPLTAAQNTFKWYDSQVGINRTCTMSAIRTSAINKLASAIKAIYIASDGTLPPSYSPQRFENANVSSCRYFDLDNYIEALCIDTDGADRFDGATEALAAFRAAMDEAVIYKNATPKLWNVVPLTHHSGLSTYILRNPDSANNKNYNTLSWYADVASELGF